jgi:putative DNA primase/helicase
LGALHGNMLHASAQSPVTLVLNALEQRRCQPRARGDRWEAFCPTHGQLFDGHRDGRHPCLGVAEGSDGRVLVNCAAGCPTGDVLEAVGLGWSSLFPPSLQTTWDDEIEMVYDYTDQDGTFLFQVVRFPRGHDPRFMQRRSDGHGRWAWHIGACDEGRPSCRKGGHAWLDEGVERVPYRLHRLCADLEADVWVVEGEKDVHAMERMGLLATCNPGGAAAVGKRCKWTDDLSRWFVDGHVVVVADQDRPGLLHALCTARSLAAVAACVRVVDELPGAKDVSDLLAALGPDGARSVLEALADREPMTLDNGQVVTC